MANSDSLELNEFNASKITQPAMMKNNELSDLSDSTLLSSYIHSNAAFYSSCSSHRSTTDACHPSFSEHFKQNNLSCVFRTMPRQFRSAESFAHLHTKCARSPSPEYVRRTRPQSPSPGHPIADSISDAVRKNEVSPTVSQQTGESQTPNDEKVQMKTQTVNGGTNPSSQDCGTCSQADPLEISVECLLLPFLQNLKEIEMRFPAELLSKPQRRLLKIMAGEKDLLMLFIPSTPLDPAMLVLRKRACLVEKQRVEYERRQREAEEKAKQRAQEEEARLMRLREEEAKAKGPATACCQTNMDSSNSAGPKRHRKLRKQRQRVTRPVKNPPKPKRVDREMQTVPEDHWLCPWCLQHIAPEAQCGHEVVCRAGFKQREIQSELQARLNKRNMDVENRRRLHMGLPPLMKEKRKQRDDTAIKNTVCQNGSRCRLSDRAKKDRVKSVTRQRSTSQPGKTLEPDAVVAKLDEIHPNDLNAMARLMQRGCSEPKCTRLTEGIKCSQCRLVYCAFHRPLGSHASCPARKSVAKPEGACTAACGMDAEEKKEYLKQAMHRRRAALLERRQKNF